MIFFQLANKPRQVLSTNLFLLFTQLIISKWLLGKLVHFKIEKSVAILQQFPEGIKITNKIVVKS